MKTNNLEHCIRATMCRETGSDSLVVWSDLKTDRGGETVSGITRKNYPDLAWWADVDALRPLNGWLYSHSVDLSDYRDNSDGEVSRVEAGVLAFYAKQGQLSRSVHVDDIESQAVAVKLYDVKLHVPGMYKACMKEVQKELGITADGALGPTSLKHLNAYTWDHAEPAVPQAKLVAIIALRCLEWHSRVVQKNPDQKSNLLGWVRRDMEGLVG